MPTPSVTAVLFDADGVLQRPTTDWRATLATFVGPDDSVEDFVADLMVAERPALVGKADFRDTLAEALARWNSPVSVERALEPWHAFEAVPAVIDLIQGLRGRGVACHLATNQQEYRRTVMQDERGYGAWFDRAFYSCDLGLAKPDPAYFRAILAAIGTPASEVLFIDDNESNIEGARSVGIRAEHYDLVLGVDRLMELLRSYGLPVRG